MQEGTLPVHASFRPSGWGQSGQLRLGFASNVAKKMTTD